MIRNLLIFAFVFSTSALVANADNSQWYWVSVPGNPSKGYFIEGPKTIGGSGFPHEERTTTSAGYPVITAVYTSLPDDFMEVISMTDELDKCPATLNSSIIRLREYDSENDIVSGIKSSLWANPESTRGRKSLFDKIVRDAEDCLEKAEEEKDEQEKEREIARKKREKEQEMLRHQQAIKKAVRECDFDFFENEMTSRERMQTYDERKACREKIINTKKESGKEQVESKAMTGHDEISTQIQGLLELIAKLQAMLSTRKTGG